MFVITNREIDTDGGAVTLSTRFQPGAAQLRMVEVGRKNGGGYTVSGSAEAGVSPGTTTSVCEPVPSHCLAAACTLAGVAAKTGQTFEAVAELRKQQVPARRFGTAEEFGAYCAFLCSVHAGFVVGQNLLLDGGAYAGTF
jgi:3-oxoacyl-[acyl-carrier protein] reductase